LARAIPRAFTLLELLAATALSAVLMVVLLQVLASLARGKVVLERDTAADAAPWQADLVEHLRWDLTNATEGAAEPNRLRLTGHGSLDRATLAPGHDPVTVTYALERLGGSAGNRTGGGGGGRTWLVRRQSPRGGLTNERGWSELVCPDVTGFAVEPVDAPDPTGLFARARGGGGGRSRGPATLDASTRAVRLRVDGTSGVIVDRVVVLR
jgi:prepilin-type N-terminal cleavage/methylation domain-containing protein